MNKKLTLKTLGVLACFIVISLTLVACPEPKKPDTKPSTSTATNDLAMGYKVVGSDATYYVFINSEKDAVRKFPNSDGLTLNMVIADENTAGTDFIINPSGVSISDGYVVLQPATAVIFKK